MTLRRVGFAIGLALLVGAACATRPIVNVSQQLPRDDSRTDADVAAAIQAAGQRYGWEIIEEGPGHMMGVIRPRTHVATVDIRFDAQSFDIQYRDSQNLDFKPPGTPTSSGTSKTGRIHRNYNKWVENLAKEIEARLGL